MVLNARSIRVNVIITIIIVVVVVVRVASIMLVVLGSLIERGY